MRFKVAVFALSLVIHMTSLAQHGSAEHKPYAGMQERPIKSLSDADIRELKRGGGWGLALAAELNVRKLEPGLPKCFCVIWNYTKLQIVLYMS